jgi:hypothetical protein
MNTDMMSLLEDIKEASKKHTSINRLDEVNVMRGMINDPGFSVAVYDKKNGYIGQRCPREEAVGFVKNIIAGATGLDARDSLHLAEHYQFTKRDAVFLLDNMRDFLTTYLDTGRKINILQSETGEAAVYLKQVDKKTKIIPDKEHPGNTKKVDVPAYTKLVSQSKSPKYSEEK